MKLSLTYSSSIGRVRKSTRSGAFVISHRLNFPDDGLRLRILSVYQVPGAIASRKSSGFFSSVDRKVDAPLRTTPFRSHLTFSHFTSRENTSPDLAHAQEERTCRNFFTRRYESAVSRARNATDRKRSAAALYRARARLRRVESAQAPTPELRLSKSISRARGNISSLSLPSSLFPSPSLSFSLHIYISIRCRLALSLSFLFPRN